MAETIEAARAQGWQVALVTTTSPENVSSLLEALEAYLPQNAFDLVVDATSVDDPKPSPAAYLFAMDKLGVDAGDCVAIEDNVGGAQSATEAGVSCVAFPNENTVEHDFGAVPVSHHLDFADIQAVAAR